MARKSQPDILQSEDSFDLTSMIDVVFLLLIYFMYLPIQQEADLMFTLPAESAPAENVAMPSEQVVDIAPDGSIFLNGSPIDQAGALEFKELASTLRRLRISSERGGTSTIVTIYPDADSPHQAAISVLNACAESGVKQVSFAEAD